MMRDEARKDVKRRNLPARYVFDVFLLLRRIGGEPLEVVRIVDDAIIDLPCLPIEHAMAGRAKDLIAPAHLPYGHETLGALPGGLHDFTRSQDGVGVALMACGAAAA